jgi:hypothetical protein
MLLPIEFRIVSCDSVRIHIDIVRDIRGREQGPLVAAARARGTRAVEFRSASPALWVWRLAGSASNDIPH